MNLTGVKIAGRYEIAELLYEGEMIYIYRGMDIENDEPVAVKLLKPEHVSDRLEDIIRFQRVADIMSKTEHPNMVRVIGYYSPGESIIPPMHCTIMELVRGKRLEEETSRRKFSINEVCEIACQVCRALVAVHGMGIIHGDIKPGNILLAETGENKAKIYAKLIDFGLSRIKKAEDKNRISGTYLYMAPEQAGIIRKNPDERSDLYSLGIVFYELLTGKLPFDSRSLVKLLHEQSAKIPDPPSKINTDIPVILDAIALKLLEKEPDNRYQTAAGLLHDLELYLSGEREFRTGLTDTHNRIDFSGRLADRDSELSRLHELSDDMKRGKGSLCFITGEAGIGKTRLMEEARDQIIAKGGICIEGKVFRESKMPHGLFYEAITDYMNLFRRYGKEQQDKIADAVQKECHNLGKIIIDFNPRAQAILGECPETVQLEQEREAQRFYMILSRFFFCLAEAEKGLILMLNDLHWSDTGSIRLIEEILRNIEDNPILIIGSFRESELLGDHPLHTMISKSGRIEKIDLHDLDKNSVRILLNSILKMKDEDADLISEFVLKKSGGNPLFIQEIVKELIAEDVLINKKDAWHLDRKRLSAVEIPETIIDTLLKRLRIFSKEEMDILSLASVIGKTFDIDLLTGISPKTTEADKEKQIRKIISIIDRALDMQILITETAQAGYSFSHDRVRDAFYERISSTERKKLHGSLGNYLEKKYRDNKDGVIFDLAYHFTESGDEDKILEYAYPAGVKAARNFSHEDAIRYYKAAREILHKRLDASDEQYRKQWIECTMKLGETLHIAGSPDETIELMQELLPSMQTNKDKARIYLQITMAYVKKFDLASVELFVHKGLALLGEKIPLSKPHLIISIIKELLIHVFQSFLPLRFIAKRPKNNEKYTIILGFYECLFWVSYYCNMLKLIRIVLRKLNISKRKIGPSRELALSMLHYSIMLSLIKLPLASKSNKKRSYKYIKKANNVFIKLGDIWGIGSLQWTKYNHFTFYDEYKTEINNSNSSIETVESTGDVFEMMKLYLIVFMDHYYLSNYAESEYYYTKCKKYISNDFHDLVMFGTGYPSGYYIEKGDYEKAEEELMKHYKSASENNFIFYHCLACIYLGEMYTNKSEFEKASLYFNEALFLLMNSSPLILYYLFFSKHIQFLIQDYLGKQKQLSEKGLIKYRKKIKYAYSQAKKRKDKFCFTYCIVPREMGNFYASLNKKKKAHLHYNKAIAICEKIGRRYELARTLYEYGVFLKREDSRAAWEKLTASYLMFEEIGITLYREKIASLLGFKPDTGKEAESPVSRERMRYMMDKSRDFAVIQNMPDLLDAIISLAMELSGARNGYLFLADDEDEKLKAASEKHVDAQSAGDYSWNIVNNVYESGKSIVAADAGADENLSLYHSVVGQKLKSVLCVPVSHNDIVSGVCYLDNPLSGSIFMEQEERLVSMMLVNAGMALENLILHKRLNLLKSKKKTEKFPASDKKYIEKAVEYIKTHFSDEMHRERLAETLGINPDYLGRLFKSRTGKTIQEYVNETRVAEAARRLAESDERMIDIAMDAGFESLRSFYRLFYRVMGATPAEYREKIGG